MSKRNINWTRQFLCVPFIIFGGLIMLLGILIEGKNSEFKVDKNFFK